MEQGGTLSCLGLLPCDTVFEPEKVRTRVTASVETGLFAGVTLDCYEIHMGRTERTGGRPFARLPDGREDGAVAGNVFGTYLHGLFDTGGLTDALAAWLLARKGLRAEALPSESQADYQERQFELLASEVRRALDLDALYRVMEEWDP